VLTHVTTEATRTYLRESNRLLSPGGSLFFTCFLLNEALEHDSHPDHRFPNRHDDGCFYENEGVVSDAVGYREETMHAFVDEAGLAIVFQETGIWTGRPGLAYQNIVIAQRREDVEEEG